MSSVNSELKKVTNKTSLSRQKWNNILFPVIEKNVFTSEVIENKKP